MSIRQVLEKMEQHTFASIPIINEYGEYIGTISEGDILWYLKDKKSFDLKKLEQVNVMEINHTKHNEPVNIDTEIEDIIDYLENQTFVPVVDDRKLFIGIVTRKAIINHFRSNPKK